MGRYIFSVGVMLNRETAKHQSAMDRQREWSKHTAECAVLYRGYCHDRWWEEPEYSVKKTPAIYQEPKASGSLVWELNGFNPEKQEIEPRLPGASSRVRGGENIT